MKCNKCGYDDSGSGDMAHVCQRPSFRYGEHPTSFGLFNPKQEPVAWIHNFIDGGISIGKRPADLNRHPDRWTALYKEPKPCPTCEALARTVMLDQTSHDTTPPQRTFVGLTDEDRAEILNRKWWNFEDEFDVDGFLRLAEATLKQKNGYAEEKNNV